MDLEQLQDLAEKKPHPINFNLQMGKHGDGDVKAHIRYNDQDLELNPARDNHENLELLEPFSLGFN